MGGPDVGAEDEPRPRLKANRAGGRPPSTWPHRPRRPACWPPGCRCAGDGRAAEARRDGELAARAHRRGATAAMPRRCRHGWLPTVVLNHIDFPSHQGVFCLTSGRSRLGSVGTGRPAGTWRSHRSPDHQGPARRHLAQQGETHMRKQLGIAAVSAVALTFAPGAAAGASTDTTEPAGTEPAGTEPAGSELPARRRPAVTSSSA